MCSSPTRVHLGDKGGPKQDGQKVASNTQGREATLQGELNEEDKINNRRRTRSNIIVDASIVVKRVTFLDIVGT